MKERRPGRNPATAKGILTTDREGGLPLPPEWGAKVGDEFAAWKEDETIIMVFPKTYRGKIPKSAYRGKVEPELPQITVASRKANKQ